MVHYVFGRRKSIIEQTADEIEYLNAPDICPFCGGELEKKSLLELVDAEAQHRESGISRISFIEMKKGCITELLIDGSLRIIIVLTGTYVLPSSPAKEVSVLNLYLE